MELLFVVVAVLAAAQEDAVRPLKRVVRLVDGSAFMAEEKSFVLELSTPYGSLEIPWSQVRRMRRKKDEDDFSIYTSSLTVRGTPTRESFEFDTSLGTITVPLDQLRSVGRGHSLVEFDDTGTLALWTFEEAEGGVVFDHIRQRRLSLEEGAAIVVVEDGRTVWKRSSEASHGRVADDPSLRLGKEAVTLEVRFRVGKITKSYAMILSKNPTGNGQERNFCLLVRNNGTLYFDSLNNRGGSYIVSSAGRCDPLKWATVAVTLDPKAGATFYIDGKKVHHHPQGVTLFPNSGPLYVGLSPPARTWAAAPEQISFVCITRGILTPEQIASRAERLKHSASPIPFARMAAVGLRDGSLWHSDLSQSGATRFVTEFGTLRIEPDFQGRLRLYRYREEDFEALNREIDRCVRRLGSESVEERDRATVRLMEIGAPAVESLNAHKNHRDRELRNRVFGLLKFLADTGTLNEVPRDLFSLGTGRLKGWLKHDRIRIVNRYGSFPVELRSVRFIQFAGDQEPAEPSWTVTLEEGREFLPAGLSLGTLKDDNGNEITKEDVRRLRRVGGAWKLETTSGAELNVSLEGSSLGLEITPGLLTVDLDRVVSIERRRDP